MIYTAVREVGRASLTRGSAAPADTLLPDALRLPSLDLKSLQALMYHRLCFRATAVPGQQVHPGAPI